jgi:hypothetical protein
MYIKTKLVDFLVESNNSDELIESIKRLLIMDRLVDEDEFNNLYKGDLDLAWKDFINNQQMGDCQEIVSMIIKNFKEAKKVFGEIEVDEPYIDEFGEYQNLVTHHWIEIGGVTYDFSKGTLSNHIDWVDIYSVEVIGDDWRYN